MSETVYTIPRGEFRRMAALALEACRAGVDGHPGAAREWIRLLIVHATRLDTELAASISTPTFHVEQETQCVDSL